MRIAIGYDHAGYSLKDVAIEAVRATDHEPVDLGTNSSSSVDYADYAEKVGRTIQQGGASRGILICGSGVGICIAAGKMKGIYSAVCHDTYSAHQGVEHDNMNVLCIGGRVIGPELAREIITAFLSSRFIGNDKGEERHKRRVEKVRKIEDKFLKEMFSNYK
jgi:ribose 5-phosphate isomerase B